METKNKIGKVLGDYALIHDNLRMVALVSASMIVKECKVWKPNIEKTNYPREGTILGNLTVYTDWSQHGFINALQSHVSIIYAIVEYNLEIPSSELWYTYTEVLAITEALEIYQLWKETIIEKQKKIYGEGWGISTEFNRAAWNDNNSELLSRYTD